jgi:hypothetical protein
MLCHQVLPAPLSAGGSGVRVSSSGGRVSSGGSRVSSSGGRVSSSGSRVSSSGGGSRSSRSCALRSCLLLYLLVVVVAG